MILLDEFDLDNKIEIQDDGADSAVKLKRLELQQQMEMAKLKLEQERLKIEEEERKEKLQLQQERLKIEQKERQDRLAMEERIKTKEIEAKLKIEKDKLEKQGSSNSSPQSGFDATKNIRLVPKFEENEVDKYFLHFEKIANSLKWPKESWTCCFNQYSLGKLEKFIRPYQLNNVKVMMQLRKQISRPMS